MNNTSVANRAAAANTSGARTTNGAQPATEVEVLDFKSYEKNTLRGFLDIMLPAIGMKIIGCTLHEKGESRWIGLPGRPYEENGEKKWAAILDFTDKDARAAFQKAALAAVDAYLREVDPLHGRSL